MEKLVASRLLSFLDTNSILSKWQFGFRSGHSTVHPMVHFLNKIGDLLNNNKHSIAIFCDLKKAFDTCNHDILLLKLRKYGLSDTKVQILSYWLQTICNCKSKLNPSAGHPLWCASSNYFGAPIIYPIY